MLPIELENIFSEFDEDDFNLNISSLNYSGDIFSVDFSLDVKDINERGGISQKWTIEAIGQSKHVVSLGYASYLKVTIDHPLLWEFNDTQCQLYFTGQCNDHAKLFYDLYLVQERLFKQYDHLSIYPFKTNHFKPFQYSNGLLAQGSKKLMEIYSKCLTQNGLDFTIIGERPARYWNGQRYVEANTDMKILFFGNSYVIAEDFSFVKQEESEYR